MYFVLMALLIVFNPLFADYHSQNQNNSLYIHKLDYYLIDSIDIIISFNDSADNMKNSVKGAQQFSSYLMELTLQVSSLRSMVEDASQMLPEQREEIIRLMMSELKPAPLEPVGKVSKKQNRKNVKYLDDRLPVIDQQLATYRSRIMLEEKNIAEKNMMTQNYLILHNHHFIYQLLHCFLVDHDLLSATNRQYLTDLIKMIDQEVYHQQF